MAMVVGRLIKKILVVDDDKTLTALLVKCLTTNGYQVTALTEASQGLNYAMTHKPHLVILDVMMPIINGFNFCRMLKADEQCKNIPVVLLTSRNQLKDINIGMEMGAEAYLTKPVNTDELLKTIKLLQPGSE